MIFLDDVVLFGKGSVEEWEEYKEILELFFKATSMDLSENKFIFLKCGLEEEILEQLKSMFPFKIQSLYDEFKYLGYFIKSNNFVKEDWLWLLRKLDKGIGHWCNRWLSLGGWYILVNSILENIPVYWIAFPKIPNLL